MHLIRAQVLQGLQAAAKDIGADFRPVLRRLKLQAKDLQREGVYIRAQTLDDVYEQCAKDWQVSDLGLRAGRAADISELGPVALALLSAPTGRDALRIAQRAMHLINSRWRVVLSAGESRRSTFVEIRSAFALKRPSAQLAERAVFSALRFVQTIVGMPELPAGVSLKHAPLSTPAVYRAAFGVKPEFNAPAQGFSLRDAYIDQSNPRGSRRLQEIAENYLETVRPLPSDDLVANVLGVCERTLELGLCTQTYVAAQIGMHPRTLQRRLHALETTFDDIRDDARRDAASRYLSRHDIGLIELAHLLGYSDERAFNRSCHRWFGASPSAVRRRSLKGRPLGAVVAS